MMKMKMKKWDYWVPKLGPDTYGVLLFLPSFSFFLFILGVYLVDAINQLRASSILLRSICITEYDEFHGCFDLQCESFFLSNGLSLLIIGCQEHFFLLEWHAGCFLYVHTWCMLIIYNKGNGESERVGRVSQWIKICTYVLCGWWQREKRMSNFPQVVVL